MQCNGAYARRRGLFFYQSLLSTLLLRDSVYELRLYIIIIILFTAIGLLSGGSGYFTCKQT